MATSGTYASFSILDILEEAYERAGLELKSGYDLRSGIRSFNFLMAEWANRGLNLWTLEQDTTSCISGTAAYPMPSNTVDALDVVVRDNTSTDIALDRMSATQYLMVPNKTMSGRPTSYFVQRSVDDIPTINLWPVPDASTYTLVFWRLRRIQAAGAPNNTADVPFRFLPALVAGLAYLTAMKRNQMIAPPLKLVYDEAFDLAADEDRDRSSVYFLPDVS